MDEVEQHFATWDKYQKELESKDEVFVTGFLKFGDRLVDFRMTWKDAYETCHGISGWRELLMMAAAENVATRLNKEMGIA